MTELLENRRIVTLLGDLEKRLDAKDRELIRPLLAEFEDDPAGLIEFLQTVATIDYKWRPVGMEDFILSPEYLGLDGGSGKGRIFPKLVEDLTELFEGDYNEAVLCGGIGWGKSTFAEVCIARMLYEMSCFKSPQTLYDLREASPICVLNVSVNITQAKRVVFERVKQMVKTSPYFKQRFPYDEKIVTEMRFPGNIYLSPAAASEGGTIGYDVWGAVMDEVNFMSVIESSSRERGKKFDQAEHVSTLLMRRMKSRFNRGGKVPGILVQVSSSKYPDDFTENKIKAFKADMAKWEHAKTQVAVGALPEEEMPDEPKVFVRRYTQWGTKPTEWFSDKMFYLYLGTTGERPFITRQWEDVQALSEKDPERVLAVPMDFWGDFEANLDGSIRDIAGYPTLTIKPFLPQMDKVMAAVERGRKRGLVHPYSVDVTTLEDGAKFITDLCKFDPMKRYYAHVDLSKGKKDKAGLCIGHVERWVERTKFIDGMMVKDVQPYIVFDLLLQMKAPVGGELQVDYVRGLLLTLREYGCNLRKVTYDQWNSLSSIQAFERMGIESEELSVDRDMMGYNALKEAYLEDRIDHYGYAPLIEEISRLEHNEAKDKVDHPPKGSKDVSDSAAAVARHCAEAPIGAVIDPQYGEFEDRGAPVPSGWKHPAKGLKPNPKKQRTVEDLMWRDAPGETYAEDDDEEYIGFA